MENRIDIYIILQLKCYSIVLLSLTVLMVFSYH